MNAPRPSTSSFTHPKWWKLGDWKAWEWNQSNCVYFSWPVRGLDKRVTLVSKASVNWKLFVSLVHLCVGQLGWDFTYVCLTTRPARDLASGSMNILYSCLNCLGLEHLTSVRKLWGWILAKSQIFIYLSEPAVKQWRVWTVSEYMWLNTECNCVITAVAKLTSHFSFPSIVTNCRGPVYLLHTAIHRPHLLAS